MNSFPPLFDGCKSILHGGDYNPDQWLDSPEILSEDIRLMKQAHCNTFSLPIFGWTKLEPEDGLFTFEWLDAILDRMAEHSFRVFLATPGGAKPAWLAKKFPEICRMKHGALEREKWCGRHNHCNSSSVYRTYVARINAKLAERYARHPALAGWHIANEYNAEPCYCPNCLDGFRAYLKQKFGTLDELNRRLWSAFWNHTFTDWDQIDMYDDYTVDGLQLEWKRFHSILQAEYMQNEIAAVRRFSDAPVTTNMMGYFPPLDYWKIAPLCDFISDDCYPLWNDPDKIAECAELLVSRHDMHRAMKNGRPFLMMESSPSGVNWASLFRLKRPGFHTMELLLAVAHGADGAMYFQWRKGRGGTEKYHGAVVSHDFGADTRVFREVAEAGRILEKLTPVIGSSVNAETAIVYDWESFWALDLARGLTDHRDYHVNYIPHYRALSRNHLPVDVIDSSCGFDQYKLLVLPSLYLLKDGVAARIREFVRNGGTAVATFFTGMVNPENLCFTGGWPGDGLAEVFGLRVEEHDGFAPQDKQSVRFDGGTEFRVHAIAERIRTAPDTEILARYTEDFYAGEPAVTRHAFGKGHACYIAARVDESMLPAFYSKLADSAGLERALSPETDPDIHASIRTNGNDSWLFVFNLGKQEREFLLPERFSSDVLSGEKCHGAIRLAPQESRVFSTTSFRAVSSRTPSVPPS